MLSIAAVLWLGLLLAGCATPYATADHLPDRMASHFGFEGLANAAASGQRSHVEPYYGAGRKRARLAAPAPATVPDAAMILSTTLHRRVGSMHYG